MGAGNVLVPLFWLEMRPMDALMAKIEQQFKDLFQASYVFTWEDQTCVSGTFMLGDIRLGYM